MSLVTMFRQADAAYLITDGGSWDSDGVLVAVGSKVATFTKMNMAIGYSGYGVTPGKIWAEVEAAGLTTTADVLRALPALCRTLSAAYPCPAGPDLTLCAITFLTGRGPACWVVSTGGPHMPPDYVPFPPLCPAVWSDVGDPSVAVGQPVNILDRASFDPVADGRALADFARVQPWEHSDGRRLFHVGGFAEVTSVGPGGLTRQTLRDWPEDRVGEVTVPAECLTP